MWPWPMKLVSPKRTEGPAAPAETPQVLALKDQEHAMNAIGYLYSAERQAGISVQASILTTWIASATYFIGAATFLVAITTKEGQGHGGFPLWLLAVPVPAFALASYHLILFAVTSVHAKSIDILEKELMEFAPIQVRNRWFEIGATAETGLTDYKNATKSMKSLSLCAYCIPVLSAVFLTIFCAVRIFADSNNMPLWTWSVLAVYAMLIVIIVIAAIFLVFQTSRSGTDPVG